MTNYICEIHSEFGYNLVFLAIIVNLHFIYVHESSHVLKSKRQFRKYINNSTK